MPYVGLEARMRLEPSLREVAVAKSAGELNYQLTCLISSYMKYHGTGYQIFNDIVGAIDNCKMEFYRRVVSPYEDKKIQQNGDVY